VSVNVSRTGTLSGSVAQDGKYTFYCEFSNDAGAGDGISITILASGLGGAPYDPGDGECVGGVCPPNVGDSIVPIPDKMELDKTYCVEVSIVVKDKDGNLVDPGKIGLESSVKYDEFGKVDKCSSEKDYANKDEVQVMALSNINQLGITTLTEVDESFVSTMADDIEADATVQAFETVLKEETGLRHINVTLENSKADISKDVLGTKRPVVSNFKKSVKTGEAINGQLSVFAFPETVIYTCNELPAGVKISEVGYISGSISKKGVYKASCQSKNEIGDGNEFTITLDVTEAAKAPAKGLSIPVPTPNNFVFRILDVKKDNVHLEGIGYSYKHSITRGCTWQQKGNLVTTNYCPSNAVNRGSMAELMWNLMGKPKITKTTVAFTDIGHLSQNRQTAIKWLASEKVTVGSPAGSTTYKPEDKVSRGQMAEFLYKLAGAPTYTPTAQNINRFNDVQSLGIARQKAIAWLGQTGITVGSGSAYTYKPQDTVNRGSMATFFMRLVEKFGGK
jgi:hypothetical protein